MLTLIEVQGLGDSKSAHHDPSFDGAHLLFQHHAESSDRHPGSH